MASNEQRIRGTIQLGPSRFVHEGSSADGIRYRVEADVQDYYGRRAKPGAVWVMQAGIAPVEEGVDSVRERALSCHRGGGIYAYEGKASGFPYESIEE